MSITTRHPLLRSTAIAATLALMGPAAMAQVTSMVATGSYSLDGAAATVLNSTYPNAGNYVDVLAFPSGSGVPQVKNPSLDVVAGPGNGPVSNAVLHSYGSTTGNFGSRSSGFGVYQVSGGFKLVELITNTSSVAQSAKFSFAITPGILQNDLGSPFGSGQYVEAGLKFDLRKGGSTIWDSSATLRSDDNGTHFSTGGDASLYTGGGSTYGVQGVSREIDLGVINAGETIELSYELTTFANGVSTAGPDRWVPPTSFTVPEGWYVYGSCGYGYGGYGGYGYGCGYQPPGTVVNVPGYFVPGNPSGSQASSGDPFNVSFGPGNQFHASNNGGNGTNFGEVIFAPVPEPSSYALLLAGLGVMGAVARRRRRAG